MKKTIKPKARYKRVRAWAELDDSGIVVADNINGVRPWRQIPCTILIDRKYLGGK